MIKKVIKKIALSSMLVVVLVGCESSSNNNTHKANKKEIDTTIITKDEILPKNFTLNHELFFIHRSGKSMGSFLAEALINSLKSEKVQKNSDGSRSIDYSHIQVTSIHMDNTVQQCKNIAKKDYSVGSDQYKVFFYGCASISYFSLKEYLIEEWKTKKVLFSDD